MTNPISELEKKISGLKVDDYEIYAVESRRLSVEAKDQRIDALEDSIERGVAIRLFRGLRTGFASSSDWSPAFLDRALAAAHESLELVEEEVRGDLPSSKGLNLSSSPAVSSPAFAPSPEAKFQIALALEKAVRDYDTRIRRVRDAGYSEETKTITLKNSKGFDASYTKTGFDLSLMVVAEENGQQEMAWESRYEEDFGKLDPVALARRTADKALKQLGATTIATRKSPALLDASVVTSFLGVLSSSFLGDQVRKNRSALRGRVGEKVHGDLITILDDATLKGGYASKPFDAEGVQTRRNVLVEKGVLKNFLYDLATAQQENVSSTGSAVRPHYKEPPRIGTSNFFIAPGSGSLEEMLKDMGTGFWVRDMIGVHTADAVSGDFSLGASGLWVENGKPSQAVRGVTVSGNIHQLLSKVTRVGGEVTWYHGLGSPPLVIKELEIGGL